MAKTLKGTILMLSAAPDGELGRPGKAVARYFLGDDQDPSFSQVKMMDVSAVDLSLPTGELYARIVDDVKATEGID